MGVSNSRPDEDKGLQLCRARKKFIKQALNSRSSLASAHIAYIEELKLIGAALRRFVEPVDQSLVYPSSSLIPVPVEKSVSESSLDVSSRYETRAMTFLGTFSKKVEEKPVVPIVVSVTSATPSVTPHSPGPPDTPPWDYFGLFHPPDDHISSQRWSGVDQGSDEEGMPELEDVEEKLSSYQESEDEFDDEPPSASLVRSFKNVNTATENIVNGNSPVVSSGNAEVKSKDVNGDQSVKSSENGKKDSMLDLSPSSTLVPLNDVKTSATKENEIDENVAPKDFFSSINDIEGLFVRASESGREVPRMLEANKSHFRPVFHGKERGSINSSLLKSCFSRGEDPIEVQQDHQSQNSSKYLTWNPSIPSHPSTPRSRLVTNSSDDINDPNNNLFDNTCMVSGSHASTLDRLYAWEKKLYDEVKAGQALRYNFDQKCKLLRQTESRGENADKTRAAAKDLHSRIQVAIHRIQSISTKVEEIRDMELQPQIEELIEGLRKMWETMLECHKLQFQIITRSHAPQTTNTGRNSDSQRQITIHLGHELSSLSFSFTKWISTQKIYVESINKWLFKCVSITQKPSKRNKRMKPPPIRNSGPPIYMMCGAWLEMMDELPSKGILDSIKELGAEVALFLPRKEKNKGKSGNHSQNNDPNISMLRDEVLEDRVLALDRFRITLAGFLGKLNKYAECSLSMFVELQKAIQEAKTSYELFKSQRSQVRV